ncbi:MAG TPA: ClpXP protease specificity-enhancing factor [Gammaproteobacteria bacterium]|nr:ClpXP protease specificity-enhancing factor [Gammaproteobacteria bacterium]
MTSNRPYLIRALYEWIIDNQLTPHLLVEAVGDDVKVPTQYVHDGRIVLNVAPSAVQALEMGNDFIIFSARFAGQAMDVVIPVNNVMAIYAKETGEGMAFPSVEEGAESAEDVGTTATENRTKPTLTVVK